ncbi:MAG: DNA adenine methylase [Mycoplasma sp.]|nr:DNA adenine methylase [Mycoplasma sp.]
MKDKSTKEAEIMLLVLVIYGFNSQIRFNSKKEFNIPVGKQDFNIQRREIMKSFMRKIKSKKIDIYNKNYKDFLNKIKKDDFVYLDPPYLITDATYNATWKQKDDLELMEFLDELNSRGISWAMSNVLSAKGIENIKLKNWSKQYNVIPLKHDYKNYQRNFDYITEEVLIHNMIIDKDGK